MNDEDDAFVINFWDKGAKVCCPSLFIVNNLI